MSGTTLPSDYYYTRSTRVHGDVSSGVIGVSYEMQNDVDQYFDLSFVLEYKKLTSIGSSDVSHTFSSAQSDKVYDVSFNLSDTLGNDIPFDKLTMTLKDNTQTYSTVTIANENIYDLPTELIVKQNGTGLTSQSGGATRFVPQTQTLSGDLLMQERNLDQQRVLRLDLSGSRTGFPATQTQRTEWISDVSFSTRETAPTASNHWKTGVPVDMSSHVYPSTGSRITLTNNDTTAQYEIALSGEAIFDISHLWISTHLKVPNSTSNDVSIVTNDLSMQIGNIARLQKIELLEYESGAAQGGTSHGKYRTIYDTPDVIYVNPTSTNNSHLYRQRGGNAVDSITDISYFIAGRDYYFFEEEGATSLTFSSGATKTGKMSKVKNTSGTTVAIGNAGTGITSVPVLVDISFGPSHDPGRSITNKTAKFIGQSGGMDVSSTMQYRFIFSHPKSDFRFNQANPELTMSGKHVVASGAAGKKNVTMIPPSETSVDVSFVIGVDNSTKDISLEDLFVTTNLERAYPGHNFGSVSGPELPNIVYPKELLHTIPSAFNDQPDNVLASSSDSIATSYKNLYTNTYDMDKTFFDVNQKTNYVEISLNHPLPSTVSAEWFKDVSFMEYSTYTGSSSAIPESAWTSVSFDKGGILTDKQTVAFSICGECLNSHNIYLRQHVVLYDPEKGEYDVSFVKDFSDHLMKQPVFKKLEILDHRDMTFKDPKNVSYVVNVHNMDIALKAGDVKRADHSSKWSDLFDLSCVARITFEEPGVGTHNHLSTHYDCDASMSYKKPNTAKTYVERSATIARRDVSSVDICGQFVDNVYTLNGGTNADVSLVDVSFSLKLKRKGALHDQRVDASSIMHTITLDSSQIWQIPTDISWVHAFTTVGGQPYLMTRDKDNNVTGKFTNVHTDASYHIQRITIDFSNGYFPTNRLRDYIKDVSFSTGSADAFAGFNHNKQQYFIGFSDEVIHPADGDNRLRRIGFDMSSDAIEYSQMWLQIRLKGPDSKDYYIIKTINNYIDAVEPEKEFTIYPVKKTQSSFISIDKDRNNPPETILENPNPLFFSDKRTNNHNVTPITDTTLGFFNTLQDMSFAFITNNGKSFDKAQPISLSYDVSYLTYSEYKANRAVPTTTTTKKTPIRGIDSASFTDMTEVSFNSFLSWRDISKGYIDKLTFYAKLHYITTEGGSATLTDISSVFERKNIIHYAPPTGTNKGATVGGVTVDVCSNILSIPNYPSPPLLNTLYPGKQISFMTSGELSLFLDEDISYDMIPESVGSATDGAGPAYGKASIMRVVKSIDICYGNVRNDIGIIAPPPNVGTKPNDVSCVQGTYSYVRGERANTRGGNNATNNILFNFDASANTVAMNKYQPHIKPTSDLSINLTFYTDLTHTDVSVITWTIPAANIDWLNPPTKSDRMEAKKLAGNSTIKNLGDTIDMSWTNVYDTSMTVVLDQKFHKFFRYRYSNDNSGMIIDASLVWAHYTNDATKTRLTDEVNIASAIKTQRDTNYVQFDISWQDFSKGLPITTDPSSLFFTMRVHNHREAKDAEYNDISFGISGENIRFYSAPTKMNDISCLYGASKTPLTDHSMTMLYGLDQCLNLVFHPTAFGHVYLPEFGSKAHPWQPDISYVIKEISYSWLHQETRGKNYTWMYQRSKVDTQLDASFVDRTVYGNRDVVQVSLLNKDISNAYGQVTDIKPNDPSAMHISIALYQDRALTESLVKCISMNIPWSDVSSAGNPPPSKVVKIEARHTLADFSFSIYGGGTVPDVNTEISFNVTVDNSFTPVMGSVSSDYIKHDVGIKYRWKPWEDATSKGETWHNTGVSDISVSLNTKTMSFKLDASNILHTGRIFEASANLFDISLQFYNTPGDATKGVVDASLGTKAPGHNDIHANKYPTRIKDVSYSIKNVHQTDKSFNMIVDSSFAVRVNDVSAEFFTASKYGKTWSVSADYVKDASVTVIPGIGSAYSFDLCTNHMTIEDASRIEVRLSANDVSKGVMTNAGRVEISFNFYTDLSGTQSQMTHIVIPGKDISAYQPPSVFVSTSTKASWTGDATPNYFTDSSLSLWYNKDISLTLQFDKPFHPLTSVSSDVILDLSYIHDFYGNNITTSNETLKSTIDISDDNLRYLTVRLDKDDLSAGIPLDRIGNKDDYPTGRKDISFVARVYRDWAKTESLATNISFAINEKDISYYHPPLWYTDNTKAASKSFGVSCEDHNGNVFKKSDGSTVKLITLFDSSVNLTISMDMLKDSKNNDEDGKTWNDYGFPTTNFHDWIHDISFKGIVTEQFTNSYFNRVNNRTTGKILPVDGSNIKIQIGMNSAGITSKYFNNAVFNIEMYSDRSKSANRTYVVQSELLKVSDISQASEVSEMTVMDYIQESPDLDMDLRKKGDPIINLKLKFDGAINQSTKWRLGMIAKTGKLEYRLHYVDSVGATQQTAYTDVGITQAGRTQDDNEGRWNGYGLSMDYGNLDDTVLDISFDPRPIVWTHKLFRNKQPFDGGTQPFIDFSMHLIDDANNTREVNDTDTGTGSLNRDHINYFFVNNSTADVSAVGKPTKYKMTLLNDLSVNFTPSGDYKGWDTTFYWEDISYHVRDISWVYTYEDNTGSNNKISKYYELSANKLTYSKNGNRVTYDWKDKDIKAKTVDVKFNGKDASGLQFGMFDVSMDLSKGTPVNFEIKMNVYDDLSYTRGGRSVTQVLSKTLQPADIEHYVYPRSIMDISYKRASGGAQDPYSATYKFSNLYDLSVNFDFSFGSTYADGDQDFTKHPLWGSTDATRLSSNFIKDLSFQWNNGPWIKVYSGAQIQNTDISLVSGKRIEFRVDQNDISTYPVQGISFNILFYKDVAKTQTYLADVSKAYTQSEISSVTLPSKIMSFKALSTYAAPHVEYTDCSLSLLDQPGSKRNWAMCRLKLDKPLDSSMQVRFDFPDVAGKPRTRGITYDVSMDTAGFYFSSLTAKKLEDLSSVGISNEHGAASGANAGKVDYTGPQMYDFGPQMTDISVNGDTIDFSLNVGHVLMGLNQESFKYGKDMSAVQFRVMFDKKSTASSGHRTDSHDISTGDISFTEPFTLFYRDISMYDGSGVLDASNFKVDEGGFRIKAVEWGGGELTASFELIKDNSLSVFIPVVANSRFSFKFKKPSPDDTTFDLSMIVHDICVNYPLDGTPVNYYCISGSELEGRVVDGLRPRIEFRVNKQSFKVKKETDVSIVVHYKADVCGNDMFRSGSVIEASYVIPGYGVKDTFAGFNDPATQLAWHSEAGSAALSTFTAYSGSRDKATMREDFSLNILLKYPKKVGTADHKLKTDGSELSLTDYQDISNHVYIYDISYAWNSGLASSPWHRVSAIAEKCQYTPGTNVTDICFQIRIPKTNKDDINYKYAFGDLSINLLVRNGDDFIVSNADKRRLLTITVPEQEISANPFSVVMNHTTISGEGSVPYGYNLEGPYSDYLKIKFPTNKFIGLSYETTPKVFASLEPVVKLPHLISATGLTPTYDISTSAPETDMSWGNAWKSSNMPKIRGIIFSGKAVNRSDRMISFKKSSNYLKIGAHSAGSSESHDTINWNQFKIGSTTDNFYTMVNGHNVNSITTGFDVTAVSPYNDLEDSRTYDLFQVISISGEGVDLSEIVIGNANKPYSQHGSEKCQRLYQLYLQEEPFLMNADGESDSCFNKIINKLPIYNDGRIENTRIPKIELTSGTNVNWYNKDPLFKVYNKYDASRTLLMFDISSDVSLNIPKMSEYKDPATSTFFTLDLSGPAHYSNDRFVLFPGNLTQEQINQIKNANITNKNAVKPRAASGARVVDVSFSLYNYAADLSNDSLRIFMIQDSCGNVPDLARDQSYSFGDFKAYNLYEKDGKMHMVADISFTSAAGDKYKMTDDTARNTITFENPS